MTYLEHCGAASLIDPSIFEEPDLHDGVPRTVRGTLETITELGRMVIVSLRMEERLPHAPGQYLRVVFEGHSARAFSYSAPLDGRANEHEVVLHIWRRDVGAISEALGGSIRPGHRLVAQGPFGGTDHLKGETPLALVGECSSFGKLWAIARWSLRNPMVRPVSVHLRHEAEPCRYATTCLIMLRDRIEVTRFEHVDQLQLDTDCVVAGPRTLVDDARAALGGKGRKVWHDPLDLDRTGRKPGPSNATIRNRVIAAWRGVPMELLN